MMNIEQPNSEQEYVENSVTQNLCRICLEDEAAIPIFESDNEYKDILVNLNLCFGDEIPDINGYPRNICETCHSTVNETVKFINKYKESCKKMKDVFEFVGPNYNNEDGKDFSCIEPEIQIIQISARGLTDASTQYEDPLGTNKKKLVSGKKRKAKIRKKSKNISSYNDNNQNVCVSDSSQLKNSMNNDTNEEEKNIELEKKTTKLRKVRQPQPRKKNEIKEKEPAPKEPTCCEYCGKEYTNRSLLSRHIIRYHDVEKPHQCTTCSKSFTETKLLKRHIRRVHSEEKNCICSECGKAFVGLSELGSHYKSSHIKKPCPKIYPCKFCGKLYTTTKSAITHERSVHTGERPAVCTICDAKFTHDDYLKIHMRLHTGETPFKCPVCTKGFSQSGNMKSHIRHNHSISQIDPEIMKSINPKYLKYMKP